MTQKYRDVISPRTGELLGRVTYSDVAATVERASKAFPSWSATSIKERARLLFTLRELLLRNADRLSECASQESGKNIAEAKAGLFKGIEVLEFALSLQNMPQHTMEVSSGVRCSEILAPLGVVCGIVPFNFPLMVPLWLYPIALALGNCFILKASEKVPLSSVALEKLFEEAGFPPGVFSVVYGETAEASLLIEHPKIPAIAFVGSTPVAKAIYTKATALGKRALCLGGAKNQLILIPDADPEVAVRGIVDSFTGCCGQRCMAASLLLAVGNCDSLIKAVVERAKTVAMGALIDRAAKDRIVSYLEKASSKLLLDGRLAKIPSQGHWIGPSIIDHATWGEPWTTDEIFGPVLTIIRVPSLQAAFDIEAQNPFGNATSVFTQNPSIASLVSQAATAGMIGVNIGVPVPREPFSFGGRKASKFGAGDITGTSSIQFWTDLKKVTYKWSALKDTNWMS